MNSGSLLDTNGYIKIAAFDHRDSLRKYIVEEHFADFKELLTDAFAPYSTGVLVDPMFGKKAILKAKEVEVQLILSREESGYTDHPQGRKTILSENTAKDLRKMGANAVKILLYFNPHSENAGEQIEILKSVKTECDQAELPLVLEPITYPLPDTEYNKPEAILETLRLMRDHADILKIEYPIEVETEPLETAEPYLDLINEIAADKPWILLSRGSMDFDKFKQAITLCKKHGGNGYAVGRAVWREINPEMDWASIEKFIRTTGADRMEQLSEVF